MARFYLALYIAYDLKQDPNTRKATIFVYRIFRQNKHSFVRINLKVARNYVTTYSISIRYINNNYKIIYLSKWHF